MWEFQVLFSWAAGALACGTIMRIWFNSDFACLVTKILRPIVWWRRNDPDLWDIDEIEWRYWLRHQWAAWSERQLWGWLSHLLGCPVCFSCHVGLWCGVLLGWWAGSLPLGVAAVVSYPYAGQWLHARLLLIETQRNHKP